MFLILDAVLKGIHYLEYFFYNGGQKLFKGPAEICDI